MDGAQYISSAPDLYRADAIVWDLGWDAAEPLGLLAGLTGSGPPAVVLMADEDRSTEAWDAGASGVLPRDASLSTLMSALMAVANAYGAWGEKEVNGKTVIGMIRKTFLIDETGGIQKTWPLVTPAGHAEEVLAAIKGGE